MTFDDEVDARSAEVYVDFLLPQLDRSARVLDVGCGTGTITLGLVRYASSVLGVDPEEGFEEARAYASAHGIANVEFRRASAYHLDLPGGTFDAALCHSVLEALERPADALAEIRRLLRPGGVVGAASVEYDGLILAGSRVDLLRRFYDIREQLWLRDGADPYLGRRLRGLLATAGFEEVAATSTYRSYGTADEVRVFGLDRSAECHDEWYASSAVQHGLATASDLDEMAAAGVAWSDSPDAYAAFAWCRALGRNPGDAPR